MKKIIFTVLGLMFYSSFGFTQDDKVTSKDLARESVLPVFDENVTVRYRRIQTKGRFEVGVFAGLMFNDPFYKNVNFGVQGSYHFTETHGINLSYYLLDDQLTETAENSLSNDSNSFKLKLNLAPPQESILLANYQVTTHYGKVSLAKFVITNLSFFGQLGGGVITVGGDTFPGISVGIGQKFYFNKHFAFRTDLKGFFYNGPDILKSADPNERLRNQVSPVETDFFEETLLFRMLFSASLIILI